MTPEEFKQITLDATKKEFEIIMNDMKKAASKGNFTCDFPNISDGAKHQLEEAGFEVQAKTHNRKGFIKNYQIKYFEVRFVK